MALKTKEKLLFYENFNSPQLDISRWNIYTTGRIFNKEKQAYVKSKDTIYISDAATVSGIEDGNALTIHPRFLTNYESPQGKSFDFISGRINTFKKFQFTYGAIQARMKIPIGAGLWPAFWLLGTGRWPEAGEIDIMESVGEKDWISAAVHGPGYSGNNCLVNNHYFSEDQDISGWHIYSAKWSSDEISFAVDETLTYRINKPLALFNGHWVFDEEMFIVLNFALGGNYPFKINGVEEPYFGIPHSTVELIKDNKAKMHVDWIKVIAHQ